MFSVSKAACFLHGSNTKLHAMEEEEVEEKGEGGTGFLFSIAKQAVKFPQDTKWHNYSYNMTMT